MPGENELSEVIGQLMNSKEARELIDKLKTSSEADGKPAADAAAQGSTSPSVAAADSSLAEQLPAVLSALSPIINSSKPAAAPHGGTAARNALLAALRPYLSDSRRALVERIMQLSRITDLAELLPRDR